MFNVRTQPFLLALAAAFLVAAGLGAGYWLRPSIPVMPRDKPVTTSVAPPDRQPLYYQDPDGKPDYAPSPKKTPDGRDFKPVYAQADPAQRQSPAPADKGKILYYRNPMGLADTSPVPKKDSMGMDYIPVYENEGNAGTVTVSPARQQMLGVRTAPVLARAGISRSLRVTGTVQAAENTLSIVNTKFDGFIEKLFVATTGSDVQAGQPLAQVWVQTPDLVTRMGPDIITREVDYVVALQQHDEATQVRALQNLRTYGVPESTIAEIRRTGRATRAITIFAPRSGTILEKPAIEGMRFNTGDPLYKIADLSEVWVMADIPERDLGLIAKGQTAHLTFVAFPGESFTGTVDFIYPTLTANSRAGRVRIRVANKEGRLREAMYATVTIEAPAGSGATALMVPESAVIDSGARQVVLVAKGGGRFEPRLVTAGVHGDGEIEIQTGLAPGEQVVVGATFLIDAESNLRAALQGFTGNTGKDGTP